MDKHMLARVLNGMVERCHPSTYEIDSEHDKLRFSCDNDAVNFMINKGYVIIRIIND